MATKSKPKVYNHETFISLFNSIARHRHRYEVFQDFVFMSAIAIHNAICPTETLEQEYLAMVAKYKRDEVDKICELLANLINLLEVEPRDVLGTLYMELELGNTNNGQFFTPHEISVLMAKLVYGDVLERVANDELPFIRASEPACGAGGMILAFANEMMKKGVNPAYKLCVQCIDIDRLAGFMCYLQLSLWHIPAEIIIGNTLTLEFRETYYTPAYYLGQWDTRLRLRKVLDMCKALPDTVEVSKDTSEQANSEIEAKTDTKTQTNTHHTNTITHTKTKTHVATDGLHQVDFFSEFDLKIDH